MNLRPLVPETSALPPELHPDKLQLKIVSLKTHLVNERKKDLLCTDTFTTLLPFWPYFLPKFSFIVFGHRFRYYKENHLRMKH